MSIRDTLVQYRKQKATTTQVPPYCIFNNSVIDHLCEGTYTTYTELLQVHGIGPKFISNYGPDIINICGNKDIGTPVDLPMPTKLTTSKSNYYAVAVGRVPGIYETWSDVQDMTRGYAGAIHKGFPTLQDAETWLSEYTDSMNTLAVDSMLTVESLSEDQQKVLRAIDQGDNVFMSGQGGTGKSFLIRHLETRYPNKCVQVCAMTGSAAELLGGTSRTIHSWAGVGAARLPIDTLIHKVKDYKKTMKPWQQINLLIVDEVSMMSKKLFNVLDMIGKTIRDPHKPFGGIQLLFSGDFYQLPPVPDKNDPESGMFCFESDLWDSTFKHVIQLTQMFRQKDPVFMKLLRQVRRGGLSKKTYELLQQRVIESTDTLPSEDITPTMIFPKRSSVKQINEKHISQLTSDTITYTSQVIDAIPSHSRHNISQKQMEFYISQLRSQMNGEHSLHLKKGAQVMCVSNLLMEQTTKIVNGSQGVIVDFTDDQYPIVCFKNGVTQAIRRKSWESEYMEGLSITQVPLILSWAITIHKSQGVTLESAVLDIGSSIFEDGQAYVALSRVKTLDKVYLLGLELSSIKSNSKVKDYYARC